MRHPGREDPRTRIAPPGEGRFDTTTQTERVESEMTVATDQVKANCAGQAAFARPARAHAILSWLMSSGRGRAIVGSVLLVAAVLCAPGAAFATRTLGLSAGAFHFDVTAGQQASGEVVVMNDGTEPLKVMVYAADQTVDSRGNVTYKTPTRADLTSLSLPSSWTTIKMPANSKSLGNIPYLELAPGQRVPVQFSVTVPPGVAPGDHDVVIFFESFEPPKPGQGAQSNVSGRLGARVTLRVAGELVNKLEVHPFNVPAYVIGGAVPYGFVVHNTGNVDQRIGARVLLLDRNDNEVTRKNAIDGLTNFAGTNIESNGTLIADTMPIGPFKVRLDVSPVDDTGKAVNSGADTISETRTVWLIPYWLVALAAVVVLLVFVRIIWVLASRATRAKQARAEKLAPAPAPEERAFPDSEYEQ